MLLLRHLKSYLPAHSILRGFVALHLCDFADAIRAGCAEAKPGNVGLLVFGIDAIRAECAEAKGSPDTTPHARRDAIRAGCAEAKHKRTSFLRPLSQMQSVRDVPKRTEGHCIQTIMRRTMK